MEWARLPTCIYAYMYNGEGGHLVVRQFAECCVYSGGKSGVEGVCGVWGGEGGWRVTQTHGSVPWNGRSRSWSGREDGGERETCNVMHASCSSLLDHSRAHSTVEGARMGGRGQSGRGSFHVCGGNMDGWGGGVALNTSAISHTANVDETGVSATAGCSVGRGTGPEATADDGTSTHTHLCRDGQV